MTVTTVWLARHGETSWAAEDRYNGLGDIPITERGRLQAQSLSERLRDKPLAAVYCSSLRRCAETAAIIAQPHGLTRVIGNGQIRGGVAEAKSGHVCSPAFSTMERGTAGKRRPTSGSRSSCPPIRLARAQRTCLVGGDSSRRC